MDQELFSGSRVMFSGWLTVEIESLVIMTIGWAPVARRVFGFARGTRHGLRSSQSQRDRALSVWCWHRRKHDAADRGPGCVDRPITDLRCGRDERHPAA